LSLLSGVPFRLARFDGALQCIGGARHPIHTFDFTALDGKDKWTAYRFTKNVYDTWMPEHFKNICSAIDQLPSDFRTQTHPAACSWKTPVQIFPKI
jgi:hypothetical protein